MRMGIYIVEVKYEYYKNSLKECNTVSRNVLCVEATTLDTYLWSGEFAPKDRLGTHTRLEAYPTIPLLDDPTLEPLDLESLERCRKTSLFAPAIQNGDCHGIAHCFVAHGPLKLVHPVVVLLLKFSLHGIRDF
jgi:hypothetical protein